MACSSVPLLSCLLSALCAAWIWTTWISTWCLNHISNTENHEAFVKGKIGLHQEGRGSRSRSPAIIWSPPPYMTDYYFFAIKEVVLSGWILISFLNFVFLLAVYHPHSVPDTLPACQVFLNHLLRSLIQRWMVMNSTQNSTMVDSFMHFIILFYLLI